MKDKKQPLSSDQCKDAGLALVLISLLCAIVISPEDAYRCFMTTEMDCLVMGNLLLKKSEQPPIAD